MKLAVGLLQLAFEICLDDLMLPFHAAILKGFPLDCQETCTPLRLASNYTWTLHVLFLFLPT